MKRRIAFATMIVVQATALLVASASSGEMDWAKVLETVAAREIPGDIVRFDALPRWLQVLRTDDCGTPEIANPEEPFNSGCVQTYGWPGAQLVRAGAEGDLAWVSKRVGGIVVISVVEVFYRLSDSEAAVCSVDALREGERSEFHRSDQLRQLLASSTPRCRIEAIDPNASWSSLFPCPNYPEGPMFPEAFYGAREEAERGETR